MVELRGMEVEHEVGVERRRVNSSESMVFKRYDILMFLNSTGRTRGEQRFRFLLTERKKSTNV